MSQEQLFASFLLDKSNGLEIALKAEYVTEATPIHGTIQKLPGGLDFLEGFMHLRDTVIPVINLKRRLGLTEHDYCPDAKVAVVSLFNKQYGLLFDDIKEVFRADQSLIAPISRALQTQDQIISALIKLEPGRRAVELLDLTNLFSVDMADSSQREAAAQAEAKHQAAVTYSRFVVFTCGAQEYGVPVQYAQEITFCSEINEIFRTDAILGAVELRGKTIPVLSSRELLHRDHGTGGHDGENSRILVLASEECSFGLIVDEVREIITMPDHEVLSFPAGKDKNVRGLYPRPEGSNIILLNMHSLVCDHLGSMKSMARIGSSAAKEQTKATVKARTHHLITENCYLVFSIGRNFAIELKDVREIIENSGKMNIPGASGYSTQIINLRGQVVPVVNLRHFYGYPACEDSNGNKLIICAGHHETVALEVDSIVTIYKQEQYHATPSLTAQLRDKKDTADRLIEYLTPDGLKEHVLVVNTHSLIRNHLQLEAGVKDFSDNGDNHDDQISAKE